MGLWSGTVSRSQSGKQRQEDIRFDIKKLDMLKSAFNRFFKDKYPHLYAPIDSTDVVSYRIYDYTKIDWNIMCYRFTCRCSWNETRNMEHVLDLLYKEMDEHIYTHLFSTEPELCNFTNRLRMILNLSGDKFQHVCDMIWK